MKLARSCFSYVSSREGWFHWNILQTGKSMHISETQPLFVPEYALGELGSPLLLLFSFFCIPFDQAPSQPNNTLLPISFSFFALCLSLSLSLFLSLRRSGARGICLMLTISAPRTKAASFPSFSVLRAARKI